MADIEYQKLSDLFSPFDIEWRIDQVGMRGKVPWARVLAYVTNRAIMERLDQVCGPQKWSNQFRAGPNGGTICGISIKCGDEWVTKWDGADNTGIEAVKGGLSGAMKRAAVQWGIGRYLYRLPAGFAQNVSSKRFDGALYCPADRKKDRWPAFFWQPPDLPKWALPKE